MSITRDQFIVGQSANARCISEIPATRMEWLNNALVLASAASTQQLNLEFNPVNDSIPNQVYICQVTWEGGAQMEQTFIVIVESEIFFQYCMGARCLL